MGVNSVEGIIFLLDFDKKKKEGLNEYIKYNKEIVSMHSPGMIISYVNRPPTDNTDLFETLTFEDSEFFVEIIDSDLQSELKQKSVFTEANRLQDKVGIDRVIEALECNMWPNMVKKSIVKSGPDQHSKVDVVKIVTENQPKAIPSKPSQDEEKIKTSEIQEEMKGESVEKREGYAELVDKESKSDEKPDEDKSGAEKDSSDVGKKKKKEDKKKQAEEDFDAEKLEDEMESFSKIFDSMKSLKEQGKNMSDEQRRNKAEELITQLMASFKADDFGDENDDDGDMM